MYVDNLVPFGRLLDSSIFSTTRKHGDMYEMLNNPPVSSIHFYLRSKICGHGFTISYFLGLGK